MGKHIRSVSRQAMDALLDHDWPGNVRELENVIQRAIAMAQSDEIHVVDLEDEAGASQETEYPQTAALPPEGIDLNRQLVEVERNYILRALERCGGRVTRAARLLNMSVRSLRYRVKKLGIRDSPDEVEPEAQERETVFSSDRNG